MASNDENADGDARAVHCQTISEDGISEVTSKVTSEVTNYVTSDSDNAVKISNGAEKREKKKKTDKKWAFKLMMALKKCITEVIDLYSDVFLGYVYLISEDSSLNAYGIWTLVFTILPLLIVAALSVYSIRHLDRGATVRVRRVGYVLTVFGLGPSFLKMFAVMSEKSLSKEEKKEKRKAYKDKMTEFLETTREEEKGFPFVYI